MKSLIEAVVKDSGENFATFVENSGVGFSEVDRQLVKKKKRSIVQLCCEKNSFNVLSFILDSGIADSCQNILEARDHENKTALHYCAMENSVDCARVLLSHGANANALKRGDATPLMGAAHKEHLEMFTLLLDHSELEFSDSNGWNVVHIAAQKGSLALLRALENFCSKRPDSSTKFWNAGTSKGKTALHIAAHKSHPTVVEFLLQESKFFDRESLLLVDNEKKLPFFQAILSDNVQMFELLFDAARMSVEHCDQLQRTPLHYAAITNALQVARILVKNLNADVNTRDSYGQTPIFQAIRHKNLAMIKFLIDSGAQLDCCDAQSRTPLTFAQQFNVENILDDIHCH